MTKSMESNSGREILVFNNDKYLHVWYQSSDGSICRRIAAQ